MQASTKTITQPELIRTITIRWPDGFWAEASKAAIDRRTSMQGLVTEAVSRLIDVPAPDGGRDAA